MSERGFDAFAEIALRAHPIQLEGMIEAGPIAYAPRYFRRTLNKAESAATPSFEQKLESFKQELAALKEKMRPFLADEVPQASVRRTSMELGEFQFRYHQEEDHAFQRVLSGDGEWEQARIPDFRGPTKEDGRWTGYYRTEFEYQKPGEDKRVILVFKGVDYKASVYLNGKCVGSHEGFFAPFEFDVTDVLQAHNTLVVEVHNDYPTLGVNGSKLDGDKIYAATGIGWDDPIEGWHHCPPGGGIYNTVMLEERASLHIHDIFVRPHINDGYAEVWVDVVNSKDQLVENVQIELDIFPRNFKGSALQGIRFDAAYAGPGMNYFRYKVHMDDFLLWEPEAPYLYTIRASIVEGDHRVDGKDRSFGMRKFHMDESNEPKGTLYLNNREIILRGANEMGHLQRCVMEKDWEQLIDDILIAKLANMNYYRITQRPVQEEIYDYMDRLGMMHQTDLPLFGYLRRNQFCEAVRQAAEMERLIRSHPSSIMVSFINEPSRASKRGKGHRHLHRDELEAFFVAARQAIYIENPDRVIKNVEGDYDPPTAEGQPDFHCYNLWYTNHALPFGKLYKGYLPPLKPGWKAGCGEYGTEGLDHYDVMKQYYPADWVPKQDEDEWMPDHIYAAQTHGMHGDWYEEQYRIRDWIRESQRHQASASRLMTDALRRRSDSINSTAIHLLLDAWPSGWMKAIVGVDRIPKPAYFEYQSSLAPVRVNLRSDRWRGYEGETLLVEAWLLNDTALRNENIQIRVTLRDDETDYASYEADAVMEACRPSYAGTVKVTLPPVTDRKTLYADACLYDGEGRLLNKERLELEVFAKRKLEAASEAEGIVWIGDEAALLCRTLGIEAAPYSADSIDVRTVVISDSKEYEAVREPLTELAHNGARLVFIPGQDRSFAYDLNGRSFAPKSLQESVYFAAVDRSDPMLHGFQPADLSYLYNERTDLIDFTADAYFEDDELEPLAFGYLKAWNHVKSKGKKKKLPFAGRYRLSQGEALLIGLPLEGRTGCNPTLDRFLSRLITGGTF